MVTIMTDNAPSGSYTGTTPVLDSIPRDAKIYVNKPTPYLLVNESILKNSFADYEKSLTLKLSYEKPLALFIPLVLSIIGVEKYRAEPYLSDNQVVVALCVLSIICLGWFVVVMYRLWKYRDSRNLDKIIDDLINNSTELTNSSTPNQPVTSPLDTETLVGGASNVRRLEESLRDASTNKKDFPTWRQMRHQINYKPTLIEDDQDDTPPKKDGKTGGPM